MLPNVGMSPPAVVGPVANRCCAHQFWLSQLPSLAKRHATVADIAGPRWSPHADGTEFSEHVLA